MGSLAFVFGLLFVIGLIGAAYRKIVRQEGAFPWFASSGAGLLLYVSLIIFAATGQVPAKDVVPHPAGQAAVTTGNGARTSGRAILPANSSGNIPAPGVTGRTYPVAGAVHVFPPGQPTGSTVKSVYGSVPGNR